MTQLIKVRKAFNTHTKACNGCRHKCVNYISTILVPCTTTRSHAYRLKWSQRNFNANEPKWNTRQTWMRLIVAISANNNMICIFSTQSPIVNWRLKYFTIRTILVAIHSFICTNRSMSSFFFQTKNVCVQRECMEFETHINTHCDAMGQKCAKNNTDQNDERWKVNLKLQFQVLNRVPSDERMCDECTTECVCVWVDFVMTTPHKQTNKQNALETKHTTTTKSLSEMRNTVNSMWIDGESMNEW